MAIQSPSTVRSAALRRSALSLAKAFDRVEVRAVGRKVEKPGAGSLDCAADVRPLMAAEVVHHDHVAGRELGHEHLVHISLERVAVDRTVENHGRDDAGEAQARHEGSGLPVMGWTPPDGIDVPKWWC
jgi:hypothetical protein